MTQTQPFPGDTFWPESFQGCTLTATYVDLTGAPVSGSVTLTPSPVVLLAFADEKIVVPRSRTFPLDANGHLSIVVPATDDPDISPVDWTYKVQENFVGGRIYSIEAPQNDTVDLVNAVPVPDANGTPIVRGPAGPASSVVSVQMVLPDEGGNVDLSGLFMRDSDNLAGLTNPTLARQNLGVAGPSDAETLANKTLVAPVVTGGVNVTGNENLTGALSVSGTTTLADLLTVAKQLTAQNGLSVASGLTQLLGGLSVTGNGAISGNLSLGGNLTVGGGFVQQPTVASDWNAAVQPGFYAAPSGTPNAPSQYNDYAGVVVDMPATGAVVQLAMLTSATSGANIELWQRLRLGGGSAAWGPWQLLSGSDTGWIGFTGLMNGFTIPAGGVAQARQIGNRVQLRGYFANSGLTGSSQVGYLPSGIGTPVVENLIFPIGSTSSVALRFMTINPDGSFYLGSNPSSGSLFSISGVTYLVD